MYRSGGAPLFPPLRVRCPFAEWTITRFSPLLIEPDVRFARIRLSESSKAVARTGLRMMPTFPPPPLTFIWLAVETQQSVEDAITVLLELYLERRANEDTFETLATILRLATSLEMTTLDVVTVEEYLKVRQALAKHDCSFDDVPEALAILELLEELPLSWDWTAARTAMMLIGTILTAGIALQDVGAFLDRHRRFVELGVDERAAEAIATSLAELAVPDGQRSAVMQQIIKGAARRADLDALEEERNELQVAVDEIESGHRRS